MLNKGIWGVVAYKIRTGVLLSGERGNILLVQDHSVTMTSPDHFGLDHDL